jgi:DNA-binding NarL/FixJ family response regulator
MLRDLGCQVVGPLGSIDKALAAARDTPLDVAVLDLNIGGEPVLPVADALAAQAVPFVFCTGYDAQSLPAEYAAALALMKPFQMDDLRDALLSTLSGQRRAAPE